MTKDLKAEIQAAAEKLMINECPHKGYGWANDCSKCVADFALSQRLEERNAQIERDAEKVETINGLPCGHAVLDLLRPYATYDWVVKDLDQLHFVITRLLGNIAAAIRAQKE